MADPRDPEFTDLPDRAFLSREEFVRAQQELNERRLTGVDEDRGLWGLATMLMVGVAGWAAVRHFPKGRIQSFVGEIKGIFRDSKRFGIPSADFEKVKTSLNGMAQVVLDQPWAYAEPGKLGQVLGSSRAAADPSILKTLQTLLEVTRTSLGPKYGARAQAVQSVVRAPLIRPIPQDASGLRTLTLGDLFDPATGGWQKTLWGIDLPKPLQQVQNVLTGLVQIPGLPQNIKAQVMGLGVGRGLYVKRGAGTASQLVDLQALHPANWLTGLSAAASRYRGLPLGQQGLTGLGARFLNWSAELMVPTELLGTGPRLGIFGGEVARRHAQGPMANVAHTMVLGGRAYPIYQSGHVGRAVAEGIRIGRTDSRMGMMSGVRGREFWARQALAKAGQTPSERYILEENARRQVGNRTPLGPMREALLRLGDRLGVGPQFRVASHTLTAEEGVVGETIFASLRRAVNDPLKASREYVTNFFRGRETDPSGFYTFRAREGLSDYANFLLHRVGHLFQQTTGLGIRPGLTPGETFGRWAGIGVAGAVGFQALRYVDYHTRQLTGTGPLTAPLQAYAALRTVQQTAFAAVGIQQTAESLENLLPGFVNSPLSMALRAVAINRVLTGQAPLGFLRSRLGAGLAGRFAQAGGATAGRQALAGAAAFTQLFPITESPVQTAATYRGEVDVAVREGRFWSLGTQPWTGGRILYTRPHLIPTLLSRARDTDVYGSEHGYWANQLTLPTPENLFGLRPLLDPYAVERRNYGRRPYPQTSPLFEEVPFVGPLLGATVGELLKPSQRWHGSYWNRGQLSDQIPEAGPAGAGSALGYGQLAGMPRTVGDPGRSIEILGKQIDILRNFLGMPGFYVGALKRLVTGEENFFSSGRQVATSGRMGSWERSFYDLELGGMFGATEMFRRFLPHRRREIELVNPIPNLQANWLPGSFSGFPRDRQAFIDFHRGDPYAAIPWGEARIPGPGYEALHRLHSGIPGVYDAYDRWKILRDVAPTSQAFRHYDTIVRSWAATGRRLDQGKDGGLMGAIGARSLRGVVRAVLDGDTVVVDFSGRLQSVRIAGGDAPEIAHQSWEASLPGTVAGEVAKKRLERAALGQSVTVSPESLDPFGRLVGRLETTGFGGRDVSAELEAAHPAYNLTAAQSQDVDQTRLRLERRFQPYPFSERLFQDPFAPVPRNMRDLTARSMTAINSAIKQQGQFSFPEKLAGSAWERMSHISLPGPFNWPVNKLFPQRDPLEYYRSTVQGAEWANWSTPYQSFLRPWMNQLIGTVNPGFVPSEVRAQRGVNTTFDALTYMKSRRLESQAQHAGRDDLAKFYRTQAQQTSTGVIITGNRRFVRAAVPKPERGLYTSFEREKDPGRRQQILELASPEFGAILRGAWGGSTDQDRLQQLGLVNQLQSKTPANWAGWHPDFPLTAMKVKVAQNHSFDIHDVGLTSRDQYLADDLFANYQPMPGPELSFADTSRRRAHRMAGRVGISGSGVLVEDVPGPPQLNIRVRRDRRRLQAAYDRFDSPAATGMRF